MPCHILQHSSKFSKTGFLPFFSFFDFFLKRTPEMKSAQSSLLTRCHLIWWGLGQSREWEIMKIPCWHLPKNFPYIILPIHCPKVNEVSAITALRVTFSTAYSLKSFLNAESFLNPHFSKSCSFPLTLAVIPFATCWHHFNFFGIIFLFLVQFSSLFFYIPLDLIFSASPPPTGPSLEE